MTEPKEVAGSADQVLPGLYHWRISNSNIGGGVSSSHALLVGEECVFIDPVRLRPEALADLPAAPTAIVLTARCHQRAAWHYRREFDVEVWLPGDASGADEEPDCRYADGDELPGGLLAVRTPGPEVPHYSLMDERGAGIVFCSDLVVNAGGELRFVPPEFHEDPAETRRSVEKLLDLPFAVLCFDHGEPITDDPKAALRRLLKSTA
jgi:hypothetical protein